MIIVRRMTELGGQPRRRTSLTAQPAASGPRGGGLMLSLRPVAARPAAAALSCPTPSSASSDGALTMP